MCRSDVNLVWQLLQSEEHEAAAKAMQFLRKNEPLNISLDAVQAVRREGKPCATFLLVFARVVPVSIDKKCLA